MVRPSICGTAATLTACRFMYYRVRWSVTYLLVTAGDLLEEVDVDRVHLGQVSLALLGEEVVDVPLRGHLLHERVDVHLLQLLRWYVRHR